MRMVIRHTARHLVLTFLLSLIVFGQSQRGKISGLVLDEKTREPLIGANVVLVGTTLGAAADLEGRFTILNIQPGKYSVSTSMLGYAKHTLTDVEVFIDRTTDLTIRMNEENVQMKEIVIVAERPKVIKDQTSTATTLDDAQIKAAPAEGLRGLLDLASSFQKNAQGNYSVRGSGSYELNFQINGVEQMNASTSAPGSFASDKANNSWKFDVNPLGVQQIQLISGGFSAEYGNAQAGVVKVVTKEGAPAIKGEVRVEYRPPGQYHFGEYLYDPASYEWHKWGSLDQWMAQRDIILKELKIDLRYKELLERVATDPEARRQYDEIVNREIAWAHNVWVNNHTPSDDNPLGVYDYRKESYTRMLVGFGGPLGRNPDLLRFYFSGEYRKSPTRLPTPERNLVYQNYLLNILYYPIPNHKIKLMAMYQKYRGGLWSGSEDIRWSGLAFTPPGVSTKYYVLVDPVRTEQTITQSINWVYSISSSSFLEVTLAHQNEKYELPYEYVPGYLMEIDRLDSLRDVAGTVLKDGLWWDNAYFRPPFNVSTNYYQDNRTDHVSLSFDYTNQINQTNLLKMGGRFYYWDMVNNGVNSSYQANTYITRSGFAEYYHAYPISGSLYLQDKMEYAGMVANLGLRAEAYNFNVGVPVDRFDPFYQGTSGPGLVGDPSTEPAKTKLILLPRLGISFPIGENTAFRVQYGHFASMPIFSQGLSQRTESGWIGRGNPNLEPKRTINYEFGLQQVIKESHRLDVALYYNDRVSQIGTLRIAALTGSRNRPAGFTSENVPLYSYTTFENNAFGSTTGLELTFERLNPANWSYRLSYSLSQTTDGNYGPQLIYPDNTRNYELRNFTGEFISGSDRTHNFRALLQYAVKPGEGWVLFGMKPFENSVVSITYTAQSGTPFTYRTTFDLKDIINNRKYPLESSMDMNATKTMKVGGYQIILGVRVMNVLNNKWLTPMDTDDDRRNWVEYGITLEDPGNDPLRLSHVVAPYRAYRNLPRQIFFTLGVGF
ncbi:MAG: carboxypeptidase-like regulatory domain-containing protein [bacterium]